MLRDLDTIQRLPPSIYKLLYDVAVYSSDDAGSIRAASLFLELMAIHSKEGNIELSLPMSDDYLSVWSRFGYSSDKGIDLSTFVMSHPSVREDINPDGSIRAELIAKFPLTNFRHYLQILLFTLSLEDCSLYLASSFFL